MSSSYPSQNTFPALTILTLRTFLWLSPHNLIFFISLYQCFVFCYTTYLGFLNSLDSIFSPILTSSLAGRQAACKCSLDIPSHDQRHRYVQAPSSKKQGIGFGLDLKHAVVLSHWLSSNSDFTIL